MSFFYQYIDKSVNKIECIVRIILHCNLYIPIYELVSSLAQLLIYVIFAFCKKAIVLDFVYGILLQLLTSLLNSLCKTELAQ